MRKQPIPYQWYGALLLGLAVLVGCALPFMPTPTVRETQQVDGLTIMIERAPAPRMNAAQELLILLTDDRGAPVDQAVVSLDLVMTEHPMGMNTPIATPLGEGRYRAEAVFTMVGPWQTDVVVRSQGQEWRAHFTVVVAEP